MEKIELTRKEWEDLKVYLEFKAKKKKPCFFCLMRRGCVGVELTKNKCEDLKAWINEGDELYSKVSSFVDAPELASLIAIMLERIRQEDNIEKEKEFIRREESRLYRLNCSETYLFNERITIKE